jgi:transcriptional regulator with XRE-family HTH domain
MAASIPALVNPLLLAWARQESGYAAEPAAKRLHVRSDRLLSWERGDAKPTVRQALALAKLYQRPLGVLFLPQPPTLPPLAAEYRRLSGVQPGVESPELRLAIRGLSTRRELTIQLSGELGVPVVEFATEVHLSESPAQAGWRVREALGVTVEEQLDWREEWQAWRRWRQAVEEPRCWSASSRRSRWPRRAGCPCFTSSLPAVGINSKETSLARARSPSSMAESTSRSRGATRKRVALREARDGDGVAPSRARLGGSQPQSSRSPERRCQAFSIAWPCHTTAGTSRSCGASRAPFASRPWRWLHVCGRRRAVVGGISRRWKGDWDRHWLSIKPRTGRFASPVDKALSRGGRPAQLVVQALDANQSARWSQPLPRFAVQPRRQAPTGAWAWEPAVARRRRNGA